MEIIQRKFLNDLMWNWISFCRLTALTAGKLRNLRKDFWSGRSLLKKKFLESFIKNVQTFEGWEGVGAKILDKASLRMDETIEKSGQGEGRGRKFRFYGWSLSLGMTPKKILTNIHLVYRKIFTENRFATHSTSSLTIKTHNTYWIDLKFRL